MIFWSNIKFSIYAFRCPALLLLSLALVYDASGAAKRFARAWFVWFPGCFLRRLTRRCFRITDIWLAATPSLVSVSWLPPGKQKPRDGLRGR